MTDTIYSSKLVLYTQKLVRERPANLRLKVLAEELGCSQRFLSGFANGHFKGASTEIVERIYIRLTGKQLIDTNDL